MADEYLTIGAIARRTGVAPSALRYYEERGLITSERTAGNQRRYRRGVIRTVSVIRAGQEAGLSLNEIAAGLDTLPDRSTPDKADWVRLARTWREGIDRRISELEALRDDLGDCIGCGCLSLRSCVLFNPGDRAHASGTGARYLLGDERPSPPGS